MMSESLRKAAAVSARIAMVFIVAMVAMLSLALLPGATLNIAHAEPCQQIDWLAPNPPTGPVGTAAKVQQIIYCNSPTVSAGMTVNIWVVPGNAVNSVPPGSLCVKSTTKVTVATTTIGTITRNGTTYFEFTAAFLWPGAASQPGIWSTCAAPVNDPGWPSNWAWTDFDKHFTVTASPTPTPVPSPTPTSMPKPTPRSTQPAASPAAKPTTTPVSTFAPLPTATTGGIVLTGSSPASHGTGGSGGRSSPLLLIFGIVIMLAVLSGAGGFLLRRRVARANPGSLASGSPPPEA